MVNARSAAGSFIGGRMESLRGLFDVFFGVGVWERAGFLMGDMEPRGREVRDVGRNG